MLCETLGSMRIIIMSLFCLLLSGCNSLQKVPNPSAIEVEFWSVWSDSRIFLQSDGNGHAAEKYRLPSGTKFKVSVKTFDEIFEATKPMYRKSVILHKGIFAKPDWGICPAGIPGEIDKETILIKWVYPQYTRIYIGGHSCWMAMIIKNDEDLYDIMLNKHIPSIY